MMMTPTQRVDEYIEKNKNILDLSSYRDELIDVFSRFDPVIQFYIGPGWVPIIANLNKFLTQIEPTIVYVQIKEKFGTMRVYVDDYGKDTWWGIHALTSFAEHQSTRSCERCGTSDYKDKVKLREPLGWIHNYCISCELVYAAEHDIPHDEANAEYYSELE